MSPGLPVACLYACAELDLHPAQRGDIVPNVAHDGTKVLPHVQDYFGGVHTTLRGAKRPCAPSR
jgi:hypothetical protein